MRTYLRLLQYMRPYWGRLVAAGACSGVVAGLTGAYAWLVRPAFDEIFINKDVTWLVVLPVVLMLVVALKGLASYGQAYLMIYVGSRVVTDIRQQLFAHLMRLPITFHVRNPSSRMMSRVVNDVNWIQNAVSGVLKDLFQQTLTFIVLLGVIFYQNWRLSLFADLGASHFGLPHGPVRESSAAHRDQRPRTDGGHVHRAAGGAHRYPHRERLHPRSGRDAALREI